jgi:hypothetical protein
MRGRALRGRDSFFWEEDFLFWGGSILEGDESTGFWAWFFWFCGRVLQTVSIIAGGTGLLGVLGTGARIPFGFLFFFVSKKYIILRSCQRQKRVPKHSIRSAEITGLPQQRGNQPSQHLSQLKHSNKP